MFEMILPFYNKVRNVLEHIENYELQMFFKAQYLLGARVTELTGKVHPSDKHKEPLGPKSSDASEDFYEKLEIPILLFTIKNERAKQGDPPFRIIALPKDGDPWGYQLYKHFKETKDNDFVFPYTRQLVYSTIRDNGIFNDLKININGTEEKVFPNDKLRKVRREELRKKYDFKRDDLEAYGITKFHDTTSDDMKSLMNKWDTYIDKLYDIDMKFENKKQPQNVEKNLEPYTPEWGWSMGRLVLHNIKYGYALCKKTDQIYPLKRNETPNRERMCISCLNQLYRIENPPKELTNKVKKKTTLADFNDPN
ncbi:MAG: hypothetical protein ABSB10_09760 [Candidatus Bathyarchaeia archaeon]